MGFVHQEIVPWTKADEAQFAKCREEEIGTLETKLTNQQKIVWHEIEETVSNCVKMHTDDQKSELSKKLSASLESLDQSTLDPSFGIAGKHQQ